ncbi:AzlD domain-containing protein [soil metagenome]
MQVRLDILFIILGAGLVTLIPRVLPLMILSKIHLPDWFLSWLSFIPITIMTALLAAELFTQNHHLTLAGNSLELIAIVPSIVVAILFRSLLGTVIAGVLCMALLRYFLG